MARFVLRRLVQSVLVMWGLTTLVFLLVRVIGNPAALMLPQDATPDEIYRMSKSLGLLDPLYEQYFRYLGGVLRGDLGMSVWSRAPVHELIMRFVPPTLLLAVMTMAVAIVVGVLMGIVAALRPNSLVDRVVTLLSFASMSMPEFWVGLILIAFVAVKLHLLPTSGYGGWAHFVLPGVTLLGRPVGRLAQLTRSALHEELTKQYVVTALSKGLTRRQAITGHALRNAGLAVITMGADETVNLVSGAVVVETVFAWPGLGRLTIQAIQNRDPDLVIGIVLFISAAVLLINLLIDILYVVLDPRIKLNSR